MQINDTIEVPEGTIIVINSPNNTLKIQFDSSIARIESTGELALKGTVVSIEGNLSVGGDITLSGDINLGGSIKTP